MPKRTFSLQDAPGIVDGWVVNADDDRVKQDSSER